MIGTGISGLGAAHALSKGHDVELFERDARVGGHSNTVEHMAAGRTLRLDTGFIVHNEDTYPNLVRLFRELGVRTQPSEMSFSVAYALRARGIPLMFLTATERRILRSIADYKTSKEIADELCISPRTVETHRNNICTKLDLHGSHALMKFALKHRSEL